jgi:hypothetical protein
MNPIFFTFERHGSALNETLSVVMTFHVPITP